MDCVAIEVSVVLAGVEAAILLSDKEEERCLVLRYKVVDLFFPLYI